MDDVSLEEGSAESRLLRSGLIAASLVTGCGVEQSVASAVLVVVTGCGAEQSVASAVLVAADDIEY